MPESNIVPPLQLPPNVNEIIGEITNDVLTKISQKTWTQNDGIDTDVDQGSDTETNNYFEDNYIGEVIPEPPDKQQPIPREILDFLNLILPEINQVNERETRIINDDGDISFNISQTANEVEITNNNDDNDEVRFIKQTLQHPKNILARILWNKASTIEIDADVLEQYPAFTANINIDEAYKNIK